VHTACLVNPIIMWLHSLAVAFSPVLMDPGVSRSCAAWPSTPSPSQPGNLFTVVDQESKYKAKNVIDTVRLPLRRFQLGVGECGRPSYGVTDWPIFGVITSVLWFPVAYVLGKRYEACAAVTWSAGRRQPRPQATADSTLRSSRSGASRWPR